MGGFRKFSKLGADKRQKVCYTIPYEKRYPFKEVFPLKYWRGYIAAAALALLTWGLTKFAAAHGALVDMVYPYVSRLIQDALAEWTSGVSFCLWQVLAVLLVVLFLASIVAMILLKWNVIQWLGWVLSGVCLLWCLHTGMYGLNQYSSSLAEDIRLNVVVSGDSVTPLVNATSYFLDKANELADQVERNDDGSLNAPSFEESAAQAADGFDCLVYEKSYSVFAGSTVPVKKLGWTDMYTAMGISGVTMPFTGEAAVNPTTPSMILPFTICHEMAHRMCIAPERDANLAAFLATTANSDLLYQYSGYFMAFRYCYNSLSSVSTSTAANAANRLYSSINENLRRDLEAYWAYCDEFIDDGASDFASSVNNAYIQASGDESGVRSYGEVTDLLLSWYWQEIYMPAHADDEQADSFDPFDPDYVFDEGLKTGT